MAAPIMPNPGGVPMPPNAQQMQERAFDYIGKVRSLIGVLKDTLANLMRTSAMVVNQNNQGDQSKPIEKAARFDKQLEEFFAICNQIELYLKTIHEIVVQQRDGMKYLPFNISNRLDAPAGSEMIPTPDNCISYQQFIHAVKNQIHYCKQVQDILTSGARMITQIEPPPSVQSHQQ